MNEKEQAAYLRELTRLSESEDPRSGLIRRQAAILLRRLERVPEWTDTDEEMSLLSRAITFLGSSQVDGAAELLLDVARSHPNQHMRAEAAVWYMQVDKRWVDDPAIRRIILLARGERLSRDQ